MSEVLETAKPEASWPGLPSRELFIRQPLLRVNQPSCYEVFARKSNLVSRHFPRPRGDGLHPQASWRSLGRWSSPRISVLSGEIVHAPAND